MTALSLLIQDAIEARIATLSDESLNLAGDPYGSDSRYRVAAQHWVAYQGSSYPDGRDSIPSESGHQQVRELEYQHYVEVRDLRRDYRPALLLHEALMGAIAGFRPEIENIRSPLRLTRDEPVSAKVAEETVYRYRATYRITALWVAALPPALEIPPFVPSALNYAIYRSFVAEVAADNSVKDAEGTVAIQEEDQ